MLRKLLFVLLTLYVGVVNAFPDTSGFTKIECELEPFFRGNAYTRENEVPIIGLQDNTSANWCGYAALTDLKKPKKGSVTQVEGFWTVPEVAPSINNSFSSIWVGIDGFKGSTVEQIGTEQDWHGGAAHYFAWFEMFPKQAFKIKDFTIFPGSNVAARVRFNEKQNTFELEIVNIDLEIIALVPFQKSKNAKRNSAEWIVEAPSNRNGILPLANFGEVAFSQCKTTINGIEGFIADINWTNDAITMEENGIVKAIPSSLFKPGDGFAVKWLHE